MTIDDFNVTVSTAVSSVTVVIIVVTSTGLSLDWAGKCCSPTASGHASRGSIMTSPGPTITDVSVVSTFAASVAIVVIVVATSSDRATSPSGVSVNDVVPNVRAIDAILFDNWGCAEVASVTSLSSLTSSAPGGSDGSIKNGDR